VTSLIKRSVFAVVLAVAAAGCGDTSGQSSTRLVINSLNATGANGSAGAVLESDVRTSGSTFADTGTVTFGLIMRDQTNPSPTDLNQVTMTRYHVAYRRTDGRNVPGVDVPYAFDSAFTVTVPAGGSGSVGFELVRITAKDEAPLKALSVNGDVIYAIAEITFYGRDLSGNDVSASGTIGITFANFADAAK
jgi:hypothetical protein